MLQEFTEKKIGYRDIMRGYIIELLVIICRLNLYVDPNRTQKMLEIFEHINAHYKENIRVEELAAIAGFSTSHFRRVFKSLAGKTPSHYIQTLRVEEACRLLKKHTMNVDMIAAEVGYSDIKHFYSVFKRITGRLPKEFR
jgi:transcriptional regulator GlxA family with amidase domain